MAAVDPYNIPLRIFRNREWRQTISITSVEDVHLDSLALVVIPSAGGAALLSNTTPIVSSGSNSATWVFTDDETGTLPAAGYRWQYLRRAYGAPSDESDLIVAGKLTVSDSPVFPS